LLESASARSIPTNKNVLEESSQNRETRKKDSMRSIRNNLDNTEKDRLKNNPDLQQTSKLTKKKSRKVKKISFLNHPLEFLWNGINEEEKRKKKKNNNKKSK